MKMQILGMSDRRAGTSKAGKAYDGTTLHCLIAKAREVSRGQGVKEIYINHLVLTELPNLNVGDVVDITYDDRGYIEGVDLIKSAAAKTTTPTA